MKNRKKAETYRFNGHPSFLGEPLPPTNASSQERFMGRAPSVLGAGHDP
jgi:hypothetical protein